MQSLYSNGFEHIYDAMYKTFINYEDEYEFYSKIIDEHGKTNVLEIGSGTGNLAKKFINSHFNYTGLDLSYDMIALSKRKNPKGNFIQGDITNFKLENKVDSVIITGRTTSYLLSNNSVYKALNSIYKNLTSDGVLSFDFIDASRFFLEIKEGKFFQHKATINDMFYNRESYMKPDKQADNFMFNWNATYFKNENGTLVKVTEDNSTVRAFTKNEWEIFLELCNFKLIEFIDRKSYAFDTYVVVAQKK
ncbi:trans-aconitate methyltransferase [Tenacibaculum adriaticum]|uniref:Trans-aconitate methyltransferase n=1 Tax=Tenacibaculum adriaticum TaxID=413713 RepID=A0A5S5DSK9_9FLAO|nr:class I SAM-dependent methyltransferase [Tenacibaculum adriaticum]TYP98913.1 trans-aconitate methyltransferase [Tenacibaculum adriaticum]